MTRKEEALELYEQYGDYAIVAEKMGVSRQTVRRYVRGMGKQLSELIDNYTPKELMAILKSGRSYTHPVAIHDFDGEWLKIGCMSDLHLGSRFTDPARVLEGLHVMESEGCDLVIISGDITEGVSHRAGHAHDCTHLGYTAQRDHAVELLKQCNLPLYMIDGNHDHWYKMAAGAHIVPDICSRIGATFLGHERGRLRVAGIDIDVWHGRDGSAYALSYRLQKRIEHYTSGDKPHILLAGHVHKYITMMQRNIHAVSVPSIQRVTDYMDGKNLGAHTGFVIIEALINETGLGRFKSEHFPFFV